MPVFEYRCSECSTKFEVLHKSSASQDEVTCPSCHSAKNKKLLSSFSASVQGSSSKSQGGCESGNCDNPYSGGCASGMCGLN